MSTKWIAVLFGGLVVVTVMCWVFLCAGHSWAVEGKAKVAVLVSRNIRPYVEALEGLETVFAKTPDIGMEIFPFDRYDEKEQDVFAARLLDDNFSLFIPIGPQAARFTWSNLISRGAAGFYTMVLNPGRILARAESGCGISLNISAGAQLAMIKSGLPFVKRLGLLYSSRFNDDFFREAVSVSASGGLTIIPLEVASGKDIPLILKRNWESVDAVWLIPDRLIVSESLIEYIIKESLLQNVPVIGFNRFFYEVGAALSFVFDYREIGRQCGLEAMKLLAGEKCRDIPPPYHVWINAKVFQRMGLKLGESYEPSIELGP